MKLNGIKIVDNVSNNTHLCIWHSGLMRWHMYGMAHVCNVSNNTHLSIWYNGH